jgi:hypothetical protein
VSAVADGKGIEHSSDHGAKSGFRLESAMEGEADDVNPRTGKATSSIGLNVEEQWIGPLITIKTISVKIKITVPMCWSVSDEAQRSVTSLPT